MKVKKKPVVKSTIKKKSAKKSSEESVVEKVRKTPKELSRERYAALLSSAKDGAPEGFPDAPNWLGDAGTLEWYRLGGALWDKELLSGPLDLSFFEKYCYQHDTYVELCQAIAHEGKMLTDPTGITDYREPNPKLRMADMLLNNLQKMSQRFGVTPLSRDAMGIRDREAKNKLKDDLGIVAPNPTRETRGRKPVGF